MLKAVIIDPSAVARGLLNTVLLDGGYDVVGATHTCASAMVQLIKHQPHIVCVANEQMLSEQEAIREIRAKWPKTLIFMVSSELDASIIQSAHSMGVSGFIVKPFKADTVLNTIRNVVIAMVKRQRAALAKKEAEAGGETPPAEQGGEPAAG